MYMPTDKCPGYCPQDKGYFNQKFFDGIVNFIKPLYGICLDIGENNSKIEYIKSQCNAIVDRLNTNDFNFDEFKRNIKYDNVFCFAILEHLQNPLWHMKQLKGLLKPANGSIYIIMPARPRFMWKSQHYFEIPPQHFQKWILTPLGLKIVRKKKLYASHRLGYYLTSIHGFLRLFWNAVWIYEIKT